MPVSAGRVTWVENQPERIRLRVQSEGPSALVLTDEYAPGWGARIDGAAAAIHPAMLAVRGVEIPAGDHEVVFEYRTPRLQLGLLASTSGLLLAIGLLLIGRSRR